MYTLPSRIAETITTREDPASLVLAVYGPWSEGKTSLLNLIAEKLRATGHIALLAFNPWGYSVDQLYLAFSEQVGVPFPPPGAPDALPGAAD